MGAQLAGSIFAAVMLLLTYDKDSDATGGHATNQISDAFEGYQALVVEIFFTYLLITVVYQTAVDPQSMARNHEGARPSFVTFK